MSQPILEEDLAAYDTTGLDRHQLAEELRAEQDNNLLLVEQLADLELALEDKGWSSLSRSVMDEFSHEGRVRLVSICRLQAVAHPLLKRGLNTRIGYIWGQGVEIQARAASAKAKDGTASQDVNAVVQAFIEDNLKSVFGSQAQEELERALGTDGEVFLVNFTSPLTGRVQTRSTPAGEIVDIITNPEDRDEPWFYLREYTETVLESGTVPGTTRSRAQTKRVAHPALGYRPAARIKVLDRAEVRWDAPMLHIPVNRLDGWKRGIPDVYAALAWARMYREFLVDWAKLTKSLAAFAWKATGASKGKAQTAAARIRAANPDPMRIPATTGHSDAGQAVSMGPGNTLEAIPKSGAHIDAGSGKPLAAMVAAGLGLPVTILLADPGVTGARATAETLDTPTLLEMGMRRLLWQDNLRQLFDYVVDQAVIAPRGPLRGTRTIDDWGRQVVTLAGDVERTVDFDWPPLVSIDPIELVKAIVEADATGKLPDITVVRLLLAALGVDDIDELLEEYTDDRGRWIGGTASAGQAAADEFRDGRDPLPLGDPVED